MLRRDFLKQASAFMTASGGVLSPADTTFVVPETMFGKVRGVDAKGIKVFKGIRYGASTAGKNRFMPPLDPERWQRIRDALEYGPSAPQLGGQNPAAAMYSVSGQDLTK